MRRRACSCSARVVRAASCSMATARRSRMSAMRLNRISPSLYCCMRCWMRGLATSSHPSCAAPRIVQGRRLYIVGSGSGSHPATVWHRCTCQHALSDTNQVSGYISCERRNCSCSSASSRSRLQVVVLLMQCFEIASSCAHLCAFAKPDWAGFQAVQFVDGPVDWHVGDLRRTGGLSKFMTLPLLQTRVTRQSMRPARGARSGRRRRPWWPPARPTLSGPALRSCCAPSGCSPSCRWPRLRRRS